MHIKEKLVFLRNLQKEYVEDAPISEIIKDLESIPLFKCPFCSGTGHKEINTYPSGLPDSGWAERLEMVPCTKCSGQGCSEIEYEPIIEIKGYKPKET